MALGATMTSSTSEYWPEDADGEVLRHLLDKGFDFAQKYVVDFNVDFEAWPPNPDGLHRIRLEFPHASEHIDDVSGHGSVVVRVEARLSYGFVVDTQRRLTELVDEFGGWCDSWGVLHNGKCRSPLAL